MNENKEFDDVFSEKQVDSAEKEAASTGFDFPKPPVRNTDDTQCTYHFAGDPNKNEEEKTEPAKHVNEYFETASKSAQEPEQTPPPFNPYQASANTQNNNFGASNGTFTTPPQQNYSYVSSQYTAQPQNEPPKKKGIGKKIVAAVVVICAVIAIALVAGSFINPSNETVTTTASGASEATSNINEADVPQISTTNSSNVEQVNSVWVAEKVRPSVVGVMTYVNGQLSGEGSGVLWMEDGEYTYVITCAHVIDASGVTYGVLLLDGRNYEATLVGADTRTDIGVVKIKATGLPLAELGDSGSLKIGEPVYAVGNPGGSEYFGSLTDGIVSAIDRSVTATYKMTCIQHNAAINPGNSGGALVNTAGQIVGINSSKIASTEYEGMGFAVPMSIAKPVAEALVKYNYVPNRPKLGIEYASVSSYQLYSMVVSIKGLPQGSLVIAGISADSSLANTEAQVGDLIIGVNGKDMDDSSVLLDLIETGAVGDTLTLTLCRIESRTYQTSTFDVTITLVEDKGSSQEEETTTQPYEGGGYYYGGASDFEDFFNDYFGW